jgi:hypothetical protein
MRADGEAGEAMELAVGALGALWRARLELALVSLPLLGY